MDKREKIILSSVLIGAIAIQFLMGMVLGVYMKTGNFMHMTFGLLVVLEIGAIVFILNKRGELEVLDNEAKRKL